MSIQSLKAKIAKIMRDISHLEPEVNRETIVLAKRNLIAGKDVYGRKFTPRKHYYKWPILLKTKALYHGFRLNADGTKIYNVMPYHVYLNPLWTTIPTRSRGIVHEVWASTIDKAISILRRTLTK